VVKASSGQSIDAFSTAAPMPATTLTGVSTLASTLADAVDDYGMRASMAREKVKLIIEEIATTVTVGVLFGFISDGIGDLLAAPRVIAGIDGHCRGALAFGDAVATVATVARYYLALAGLGGRGPGQPGAGRSGERQSDGHPR